MPTASRNPISRSKTRESHYRERNKAIVALCETMTLKEIAQRFGISQQRVSEIYQSAQRSKQRSDGKPISGAKKPNPKRYTVSVEGVPMTTEDAVAWAVDHYWKTNYRAPTFREIRDLTGISSISHISYTVARIAEKHKWRISSEVSRTITPQWVVDAIDKASPKGRGK